MKNVKMTKDEQLEKAYLESLKLQKNITTEAQEEPDSHLLKVHYDFCNEYGDCDSGVIEWKYTEKDGIYSFKNVNESTPREHSSIKEFIDKAYPVKDSFGGKFAVSVEDEDGNVVYKRGYDNGSTTEVQEEPESHLLKVHWDYSSEYGDFDSGVTEWRYTKKDGIYSFKDEAGIESTPREHRSIEEFIDSTYPENDAFCGGYTLTVEDEDGNVVYKRGDDQKTI